MAEQSDTTNPTLNDREALRHLADNADFLCDGELGVYLLFAAPPHVFQFLCDLDGDTDMDPSDFEPDVDDEPDYDNVRKLGI